MLGGDGMLVFLLFLVIVGGSVLMIASRGKKEQFFAAFGATFVLALILIVSIFAMRTAIEQVDAYDKQSGTVTTENKTIAEWMELVEERFSDEPQLAEKMKGYLQAEIKENENEAQRITKLRDEKVEKYKKMIWPLG